MYFGATTFAEDCFGAQGVPNTIVEVSGIALAMNAGSSSQTGDANLSVTGSALTSAISSFTVIKADANVSVTGSAVTISVGVSNGVAWGTVDTGTAQTYSAVRTGTSQTWTDVSTGTSQTWKKVDEVEKVA